MRGVTLECRACLTHALLDAHRRAHGHLLCRQLDSVNAASTSHLLLSAKTRAEGWGMETQSGGQTEVRGEVGSIGGVGSFMDPFISHWRTPKEQLQSALESSLIVLDSSVLLDLYRVTPTARVEMIRSLNAVKDRIWIPHQVALEFHRNRIDAAQDQLDFYNETCKSLESAKNQALQKLNEFANRCALGVSEKGALKKPIEKAFNVAIQGVRLHEGKFDLTIGRVLNEDPVLEELASLFDGRVGPAMSEQDLEAAEAEAKRRKVEQIPPGYKDGRKRKNAAGDYIVWEQTLLEAELRRIPVVIVSNDDKEDWVTKRSDFSMGPREELVREMEGRAGVTFRLVKFSSFLEATNSSSTSAAVSRETLSQAKMASRQSDRRATRIIISEEQAEGYLDFLRFALESSSRDLESASRELATVQDDEDVESLLRSEVDRAAHGVVMFKRRVEHFEHLMLSASRLKGDVLLDIEDPAARKALIAHIRREATKG